MRISDFARRALGIGGAVALLSGCNGSQSLISQLVSTQRLAPPPSNPAGERVLYRFKGGRDGSRPYTALLDVNGTLFGTTTAGTIFSIETSGLGYNVLHRYPKSGKGGAWPLDLTYANGELYGTTEAGGNSSLGCSSIGGCGTIFKMDPSGNPYSILYRFKGAPDGTQPSTALLDVNGTFYGATEEGGTGTGCRLGTGGGTRPPIPGCGTLYEVSPTSGKVRILYNFPGAGGTDPGSMISVNGTLYGTTVLGGLGVCAGVSGLVGCGTIFRINPSGDGYHVVYRFKGSSDGGRPNNVIDVNGTLYGTTAHSASYGCDGFHGCDTLFKFDIASGRERVLHRFQGGRDGLNPNSLLAYANGTLYGTTVSGGDLSCRFDYVGCGTVFKFDIASGKEQVLYRFRGGRDGAAPYDGVIEVNGALYGTTAGGGAGRHNCINYGCGTIFEITP
ncbi:MAG: choice-of-anchor tandem repeat GloVer-containing protein [Candidatus Cybelea sp.]